MAAAQPADRGESELDALVDCIDRYVECPQACTVCADDCLAENTVAQLSRCAYAIPAAPTSADRTREGPMVR